MSDVGDDEYAGLRVGPYLPEAGVAPSDGSPGNAVTEFIPPVSRGGAPTAREVLADNEPGVIPAPLRASMVIASTDEWLIVERRAELSDRAVSNRADADRAVSNRADADEDRPGTALVPRRGATVVPARPRRRGPVMIDADNWNFLPAEDGGTNEAYAGRRRANRPTGRVLLALGALLVAVAGGTGFELVRRASADRPSTAAPGLGSGLPSYPADDGLIVGGTPAGTTGEPSARASVAAPAATSATAPGKQTGSPSTATSSAPAGLIGPSSSTSPSGKPSASPSPSGTFQPLTIEAEASGNTLVGSAAYTSYPGASGGTLVGYLGKMDDHPIGTVTFTNINVPSAGSYVLVVSYVASSNRTAHISINDGAAIIQTAPGFNGCCGTLQIPITLRAGVNTISFSNPKGRCPAIDKVIISQP